MAKKKLTEEQLKEIKILQANNEMLERTKAEAAARGKDSVKLIEIAQQDVISQMGQIDADAAKEMQTQKTIREKAEETINIDNDNRSKTIYDTINELNSSNSTTTTNVFTSDAQDVQYDVISLPSNGEGYKNKLAKLPVAYLTAYDENFITSPNLYRDGLIIDFLLKNKILKKDIDIDNLLSGDVDAIILFLRATSYGVEFPVSVRDPQTGKAIETVIDLSTLKSKDFKLKGDANGLFDFELPLSHDLIKFKYLTRKDEKNLEMITKIENKSSNATVLRRDLFEISELLSNDETLSEDEKKDVQKSIETIDGWRKKMTENNVVGYNKIITNRMEMNIVSINGNTDRQFIHNYINTMRAKDSLELRKYINDNEPGIDFEVEITRPLELGGGSFKTFLEWNDSVFLNIA